MITSNQLRHCAEGHIQREMPYGFGNILFVIAGIIGVAVKNGYTFGFADWKNQEYFINPLPKIDRTVFKPFNMPVTYKGFDVGFCGFDVPDNSVVHGYFGSEKYFKHCEDLIRHYFMMRDLAEPYKDCILVHYRNYYQSEFAVLDHHYYLEALEQLPDKRVVVITDNIAAARNSIKLHCEYVNNSPVVDFYLLTKAEYLVMANSTFSWWGAWLSKAKTVAPKKWYAGQFRDCPTKDLYLDDWILV